MGEKEKKEVEQQGDGGQQNLRQGLGNQEGNELEKRQESVDEEGEALAGGKVSDGQGGRRNIVR